MKPKIRLRLGGTGRALALIALACSGAASAQPYPAKPIRIVLTIAGGADIAARVVAQHLGEALGQPVVMDVQSAAGGLIGGNAVMRAAPDGYTLLLSSAASQIQLARSTRADVAQNFSPITKLVESTLVVVANPALPVTNVGELVSYARRNPGKLFYSTSSIGGVHHVSGEQIAILTGIQWVHVPYKGSAQALMDAVTAQVQVNFTGLSTALEQIRSGKIRILGVNNAQRNAAVPGVPTISEQLPGYQPGPAWLAYFGPAGMPRPLVTRLHSEIAKVQALPDARAKIEAVGFLVVSTTPEELLESVRRDVALVNRIIDAAGIKLE